MEDHETTPLDQIDFHNILLWMPNWIGDVVFALPALCALREKFPNARITTVAKSPTDEILLGHPAVDTVFKMPAGSGNGFLPAVRFARKLRKYRFDLGIVFPNSIKSAILLSVSGAGVRLGYKTEGRELFLTHPQPVTPTLKRTEYRVDYFFKVLSPLGLKPPDKSFASLAKKGDDRGIEELMNRAGLGESDYLIALHPGTSKPQRSWHAERFGILCQKLCKEHQVKFLLLGDESDEGILNQIHRFCPPDAAVIPSKVNLREIVTLLKRCQLFIGNDSGMMHLAAMANTPVVGIFGPGSPATTGPYMDADQHEIVSRHFSCSPCRQRFFKECKPSPHNKPFCLEDISVLQVAEAVDRMMQKIKKPVLEKK